MKDALLHLLQQYPQGALFISLLVSIVVAIAGVLPSFFITGANILFFGFWQGTLLSFFGEALGAAISFILYRKGFGAKTRSRLQRFPKVQALLHARGGEAFILIFSLRLLPFVPSGLITFAGAIGHISFLSFCLASTLGKLPALLIEAYSVYNVLAWNLQGKIISTCVALFLVYLLFRKRNG